MNKHREAEKNIKLLAGMVKGLVALVPDLDRLGGFDKLIEEAQGRLDAVNVEAVRAGERLASVDGEVAQRLASADEQAGAIIAQGERQKTESLVEAAIVGETVVAARKEAADILEVGKRDAEQLVLEAQRRVDELAQAAADAQTRLEQINGEIVAAAERKAALDVELTRVREFLKA